MLRLTGLVCSDEIQVHEQFVLSVDYTDAVDYLHKATGWSVEVCQVWVNWLADNHSLSTLAGTRPIRRYQTQGD